MHVDGRRAFKGTIAAEQTTLNEATAAWQSSLIFPL